MTTIFKQSQSRMLVWIIIVLFTMLIALNFFSDYNEHRGYPPLYPLQHVDKAQIPIYHPPKLQTYNLSTIMKETKGWYVPWEGKVNISYGIDKNIFTDINDDGYADVIICRFAITRAGLPENVSVLNTTAIDFHNNKVLWSVPEVGCSGPEGYIPLTDLNNDGRKELVITKTPTDFFLKKMSDATTNLAIVDTKNGTLLKEMGPENSTDGTIFNSPMVADINNDGIKEIIAPVRQEWDSKDENWLVPGKREYLAVYNSLTGEEIMFNREFKLMFNTENNTQGVIYNNNTLGHLIEIDVAGETSGRFFDNQPLFFYDKKTNRNIIIVAPYCLSITAFDAQTGEILWASPAPGDVFQPKIGDINGDGEPELVTTYGATVAAIRLMDGKIIWQYTPDMLTPVPLSECSLGDLNGDGTLDVVVFRDYGVFAINGKNGKVLWKYVPSLVYNSDVTRFEWCPPILADLDNDGKLDILLRGANVLAAEKLDFFSPPTFVAFRGYDGQLLWNYTLPDDGHLFCDPYVVDIDDDGHVEIVFTFLYKYKYGLFIGILHGTDAYPTGSRSYTYALNGADCDANGNILAFDPDADTLSTSFEKFLGTDPYSSDTDNDLLPDYYEYLTLGTSPTLIDTNHNGINDTFEDFDHDGLNNLQEFQFGTNPLCSDTDHDLLPDGYDPYPLYPDGRFYWSFGACIIVVSVSVPFIIKSRRRRKRIKHSNEGMNHDEKW